MDYSSTLLLPQTQFSLRRNSLICDILLQVWQVYNVYQKSIQKQRNDHKEFFIVCDGPPFANGHLHLGHALNKYIKDTICRIKRLQGYAVVYVPGWDCHGLPIESKVELTFGKANKDNVIEFREECAKYAQSWIDIQKQEFIQLGIEADWHNFYATMNK